MTNLPTEVMAQINDNPKSVKVIGTKAEDGKLHIIAAGSVRALNAGTIVVGARKMIRTSSNLESMKKRGENALIEVIDWDKRIAFEIQAKVKDFQTSGPVFEAMADGSKKMGLSPPRGVWILEPTEIWNESSSASPDSGKRIV